MKTAQEIIDESRKLREQANLTLAGIEANLKAMLKRGEAWLCRCGHINGHHNPQCCNCGDERPNRSALAGGYGGDTDPGNENLIVDGKTVQATAGSVKVRIAVAVCPSGKWNSCGWNGGSDRELVMFAGETLEEDGEEYYFVEATLPIPTTHPIAVHGTVKEANKALKPETLSD